MNIRGFWAMILATVLWGNFVFIFAYLRDVAPLDIVAHRVIWGGLFFAIFMALKGRTHEVIALFGQPRDIALITIAAFLVLLNWLGFVWAVSNNHTLDAGLGYFIYPLVSVAMGVMFKGERPTRLQITAIVIATVAVAILTYGLGRLPLVTLLLAITFASYAFVKSYVKSGAVLSVTVENIILYPFALGWLIFAANHQIGFLSDFGHGFWLIMSGVLTGVALIAFSFAAKTLNFAAIGMLFFINPTLQVINASVFLGEEMSRWHKIAFPLIAVAVVVYSYDLWKRAHPAARPVKMP